MNDFLKINFRFMINPAEHSWAAGKLQNLEKILKSKNKIPNKILQTCAKIKPLQILQQTKRTGD